MVGELETLQPEVLEQSEVMAHYDGYIEKQRQQVRRAIQMESTPLDTAFDYNTLDGLRLEARQKLNAFKPINIGQASRISGVSPSDVAVLLIHVKRTNNQQEDAPHAPVS